MASRNLPKPCPGSQGQKIEHEGDHSIKFEFKNKAIGVFDDCFIELIWEELIENTPYEYNLTLSQRVSYPVNVYYGPAGITEHDKVAILSIDHSNEGHAIEWCVESRGTPYGTTWTSACDPDDPPSRPDRYFWSYVMNGNNYDNMMYDGKFYIDKKICSNHDKFSALTACHELTHNLYAMSGDCGPWINLDSCGSATYYDYGLMCFSDLRWYLRDDHIMALRSRLPLFDQISY